MNEGFWEEMGRPPRSSVEVGGVVIRRGSRVRLKPRARGDVFDRVLDGRMAIVEGIDEDHDGGLLFAVTLEDDPGRDLGEARQPGHRFFFSTEEIEPDRDAGRRMRILVAGIGNWFLGDDGFGVEVARRLARDPLPPGVEVVDFGIRSLDLAYALQEDYALVVLVDAMPRGGAPGSLYVLEPDPAEGEEEDAELSTHGMDPARVLRFARRLGRIPPRILIVGCEPQNVGLDPSGDVLVELSDPVQAAVEEAAMLVLSLLREEEEVNP